MESECQSIGFEDRGQCLEYCENGYCCEVDNPFESTDQCIKTTRGRCGESDNDFYSTLEECERVCNQDCCCLSEVRVGHPAESITVVGMTSTETFFEGDQEVTLTISVEPPSNVCPGEDAMATFTWEASGPGLESADGGTPGVNLITATGLHSTSNEGLGVVGSLEFPVGCGIGNAGGNPVNHISLSVFQDFGGSGGLVADGFAQVDYTPCDN